MLTRGRRCGHSWQVPHWHWDDDRRTSVRDVIEHRIPDALKAGMKKIINAPAAFVDEMLDGLLAAHPDMLRAVSSEQARRSFERTPLSRATSASSRAADPDTSRSSSATWAGAVQRRRHRQRLLVPVDGPDP